MKAEIHPGYDKKRIILGEAIPLDTPFTIFINPSTICNFKCRYCTHGKGQEELEKLRFKQKNMDYEMFLTAAEQLKEFPDKFKLIYLYGNGEPLCNPRLPDMVEHLSRLNVTEKLEFFTNGALLSHEKSLSLIDAGLTKIKVSIQAVTKEKYRQITGVDCNFDNLIEQIGFFHEHRKKCKVYVKIMDDGLSNEEKDRFYQLFGDLCDEIYIEHMTFTQRTMDSYENMIKDKVDLYGEPMIESNICTFPFYVLRIGVDGELNPCFENIFSEETNIRNMSIYEYWNSKLLRDFRLLHLRNSRDQNPLCNGCRCLATTIKPEDRIDNYADQILRRMGEK